MSLLGRIEAQRPAMIHAAQRVLDGWTQDAEGACPIRGSGGACDDVASALATVLHHAGIDTTEGGQDGDDHAWIVAYDADKAFTVDIPPGVYETGGGYNWRKREGVVLTADDIAINEIPRHWVEVDTDFEGVRAPGAPGLRSAVKTAARRLGFG